MNQPTPEPERFQVGAEGEGVRLDVWLTGAAQLPRAEVQAMIEEGAVTVDGDPAVKSRRLHPGETVGALRLAAVEVRRPPATFRIAWEDEHLAVVVKPAGVVVHPAPGNTSGTLVEALAARMPLAPAAGEGRPGIVHRLDKDTSGLMVVAKTDQAYAGLSAALGMRSISRTYLGLVLGAFAMPTGRIEAPMGRSPRDRTRMGVVSDGRDAVTEFEVLEAYNIPGAASYIEVHLHTGRTHQIRVHLAHIRHPVVGDATYGRATISLARKLGLKRPFLHATRLAFVHPVTGETVDVSEPLPPDLQAALGLIRGTPLP